MWEISSTPSGSRLTWEIIDTLLKIENISFSKGWVCRSIVKCFLDVYKVLCLILNILNKKRKKMFKLLWVGSISLRTS